MINGGAHGFGGERSSLFALTSLVAQAFGLPLPYEFSSSASAPRNSVGGFNVVRVSSTPFDMGTRAHSAAPATVE